MRKFAGFLIFIGFVLIGMSCYQMFVGDIPFLSFMEKEEEDSEVIGPPIKVEKISTIEYTPVVGEDYEVNKEDLEDNVNNSFYLNFKLGKESYRLSFNYPDYLSVLKASYDELTIGNDSTVISFNYEDITYEEYKNFRNNYNTDGYFAKTFEASNEISKVCITKVSEGNDELFMNKAEFLIFDLKEEGKPLLIRFLTKNKKIPDSLILNFYNSFKFEKIDNDLQFCKTENSKYVCNFKVSNFDNSSKKKVVLEFEEDIYDIEIPEKTLIPSSVSIKSKEGLLESTEVTFDVLYDSTDTVQKKMEASNYVEEIINGNKFMVRNYINNENKKYYYYEVQPNVYIKMYIETNEGSFDSISKTFINFKIK